VSSFPVSVLGATVAASAGVIWFAGIKLSARK
jgi:hypothetical protein